MTTKTLLQEYERLEKRFREQVHADNSDHGCESIYLPNVTPSASPDYIFVAMEPSLGPWAKNLEEAQQKIDSGFRNFAGDHLLHFCIRNYLCQEGEAYHLTDISKGAMVVNDAGANREKRYNRWYPLLLAEIDAVGGSQAKVISIGKAAGDFLTSKGLETHVGTILHFSGQATLHREKVVIGREQDFLKFARTADSLWLSYQNPRLDDAKPGVLSDSKKKLMFTYKLKFEELLERGKIT